VLRARPLNDYLFFPCVYHYLSDVSMDRLLCTGSSCLLSKLHLDTIWTRYFAHELD